MSQFLAKILIAPLIFLFSLAGIDLPPPLGALSVYQPVQGGSGTSAKPTRAQLLAGNQIQTYSVTTLTSSPFLTIDNNATGTLAITASSSPTFAQVNATSTATSTFAGGVATG